MNTQIRYFKLFTLFTFIFLVSKVRANDPCAAVNINIVTAANCGNNAIDYISGTSTSDVTPFGNCANTNQRNDWWAKFTGDGSLVRVYSFEETQNATLLMIYRGTCNALNYVDCGYDNNRDIATVVDIQTVAGETYFVRIMRPNSNVGPTGKLCVYANPTTPFVGICDEIAAEGKPGNPINLSVGSEDDCETNAETIPTTHPNNSWSSGITPLGCGATQQRETWYSFVATSNKTAVYVHNVSNRNTGFMVYSGACGQTMNLVSCQGYNANVERFSSFEEIETIPGQTYYVRVSRRSSNSFGQGKICVWNVIETQVPTYPVCNDNASFELGNTNNWTCKTGFYNLNFTFNNQQCLNPDGNDAFIGAIGSQTINGGNRHVIMTDKNSRDPYTQHKVKHVAPGGGDFSFRLGNPQHGCGEGTSPCPAQAEGMSFNLNVTESNAGFHYMYAAVLNNPGHDDVEQPRFEVSITTPNGDEIDCGYFQFVAGSPLVQFKNGIQGWIYTDWTEVALDLTAYIGQTITIEFRVAGCYPSQGGGVVIGGIANVCVDGIGYECITNTVPVPDPANNPNCTPIGDCTRSAGTHSAYVYLDAYCTSMSLESPEFCVGQESVEICAPNGYTNYSWPEDQPGIQGPFNQQCVTINNPVPGTVYNVNMELITGCPTSTTITLRAIPIVKTQDTTICLGDEVSIFLDIVNGQDPPYTISWDNNLSGQGPHNVSPTETTTYTASVSNASGCTTEETITITVNDCGLNVMVNDTIICTPGECVTLTAVGNNGTPPYTFSWSPNIGAGAGPHEVCPNTTSTYEVTITDAEGLTNSKTATVLLAQFPAKILANDTTLCEGDTLILTPNVNNASYLWQDNTSTPTFEVVSSGQYSVIASIGPCTSEDLINVGFFPTPDLSVITDTIFCLGETLEIDLTNTGTSYLWSDNTTSPTFAITQSGDYFVTVSNQGCAATKNFSVEIDPCGKSLLNIPNVFSPNGDGINDKFEFEIAGYKTLSGIILNRWGKVIYQWEGFESYWDGGESPAGVYFYIVNAVDFNEKSEEQKGTITLIR